MEHDIHQLKEQLYLLTRELLASCRYCTTVSSDIHAVSPVPCTKWSGSSFPVFVNVVTCLSCGEYNQSPAPTYTLRS